MRKLEGAQQSLVEQLMRRQAGDILARHGDAARGWFQNPGDDVEKCRFSGPVRTDEAGDRALFDGQAGAVDGAKALCTRGGQID